MPVLSAWPPERAVMGIDDGASAVKPRGAPGQGHGESRTAPSGPLGLG